MGKIKVNPEGIKNKSAKINDLIDKYEKHIKELTDLIQNNEAQLDDVTYSALNVSVSNLTNKLNMIKNNLDKRSSILTVTAVRYSSVSHLASVKFTGLVNNK